MFNSRKEIEVISENDGKKAESDCILMHRKHTQVYFNK